MDREGLSMDDLISRQAAIENSFEVYTKEYGWCEVVGVDAISELPSAQPEIIRCKDCENWDKTWTNDFPPNHHYCPMVDGVRDENFYCADAGRREE